MKKIFFDESVFDIVIDDQIPDDEVWFELNGRIVGKIVGIQPESPVPELHQNRGKSDERK